MEEINFQVVPNPLVSWGIIIASLASLQENIKEAKSNLGIKKSHVGIDFPYTQQKMPSIVLGLNNLEVKNSGFYSAELTEPRNQVLMSSGDISLDIYTTEHNHLMTIADFITQCYLLNLFDQNKMFYPGQNRSWVAMSYAGGLINWSPFNKERPPYTDETYVRYFHTSTNLKFKAEHHISTELARISAVTIEAIPLNRVV